MYGSRSLLRRRVYRRVNYPRRRVPRVYARRYTRRR